jgi:two-component system KDP operon response regulator KdpE
MNLIHALPTNPTHVLVVEDDPTMQHLLRLQLVARGFEVDVVGNGHDALTTIADEPPDVVLLDITLPGDDGLQVCREIRRTSSVPVILVTAADAPQTKVAALELGGDDYLTKPFHMEELVARIRAVLRRTAGRVPDVAPPPVYIQAGALTIDTARREALLNGAPIHLTKIEFDLLHELATHSEKVLTYHHLLKAVWGPSSDNARLVHVHIFHLRRKIGQGVTGPRYIVGVSGIGYRFQHPG